MVHEGTVGHTESGGTERAKDEDHPLTSLENGTGSSSVSELYRYGTTVLVLKGNTCSTPNSASEKTSCLGSNYEEPEETRKDESENPGEELHSLKSTKADA